MVAGLLLAAPFGVEMQAKGTPLIGRFNIEPGFIITEDGVVPGLLVATGIRFG